MVTEKIEIDIDLNPDILNNLYFHFKSSFSNPKIRFINAFGGSSGSKTYSLVQAILTETMENEDCNTIIFRKYSTDIKDSIYSDFKSVISDWGLGDHFLIQQNFILCSNGSYIRFRGLDDSEKVKGISNFKRVVLEELSQFEEADFKQIRKRLRGRSGQQIISLFNPISDKHWIKTKVFDLDGLKEVDSFIGKKFHKGGRITKKWVNAKGNGVWFKTTYLDNKYIVGPNFIDHHTIDDFELDKERDPEYYEVYALGNWGRIRTGSEFYHTFRKSKHTGLVGYDPNLPTHLCFDFNVHPYMTLVCCQLKTITGRDGKDALQVRVYKEFCLKHPFNTTEEVCKAWERVYGQYGQALFYYGDSSGKNRVPGFGDLKNYDTVVTTLLKHLNNNSDRVLRKNPNGMKRRDLVQKILRCELAIELIIDESCVELIKDFEELILGPDGKHKPVFKDKALGISYELLGHTSDAFEGFICSVFENLL